MSSSLQRRLSIWLSIAIVSTGILTAIVLFFLVHDDTKEYQDHTLNQIALLEAHHREVLEENVSSHPKHPVSELETRIAVVHLPDDARPAWLTEDLKPGFRTLRTDQGRLRVFMLRDASGKTTVVAQPTNTRDEIALNSAVVALLSLLLLLPLMVWITVRIIRKQFAPVNQLASHLDTQRADRPDSLPDRYVPDEIMPFVHAINRLLQRINDLMGHQRRFIADAAHELRSPLTALSIQVQNLKQSGTIEAMRERTQPLQAGIERARNLTERLLDLARTQAGSLNTAEVDVAGMARELIAEYLPLAQSKNIDLGLEASALRELGTAPETLRLVIRNALENALKYTPEGGEVTVRLYSNRDNDIVEIIDNGPGIPAAELVRVFDPFYRIPGSPGEGSGLGLSIAREAAVSLGGTLSLQARPEGSGLIFRYQQNHQLPSLM